MKHPKTALRLLACLLACLLTLCLCTSCAVKVSKKNTLMSLGKSKVTVNTYELLLSRLKGNMAWSVSQAGQRVDSDSFWDTVIDMDGTTLNEYYSDAVLATLKEYLIALYLFDEELGLKLPDATVEEIDATLDELIEYDANGSRTQFNALLADYGVNYKMLREVYLLEAKYAALQTHLYGANGALIASSVKDEFCREKFVACKQLFIPNYYDTGLTDEEGYSIYETYDEETLAALAAKAGEARIAAEPTVGDSAAFEALIVEYAGAAASTIYLRPEETYGNADESMAYLDEVTAFLADAQIGDLRYFEAPDGWHIVMKYAIEDGAASDSKNADWFEASDYSLSQELIARLFHEKCATYADRVVIYDAILSVAPDMKSVAVNYYY